VGVRHRVTSFFALLGCIKISSEKSVMVCSHTEYLNFKDEEDDDDYVEEGEEEEEDGELLAINKF
jgi:hypothetical protein